MDFDDKAELTFISNNFPHEFSAPLSKLHEQNRLYIENIFKDYKPINDFLRKALARKIKPGKLYELDFETRARVIYDDHGKIRRLHVIIQELENESSGSGHIYRICSSKTMNDSEGKAS